MSTPSSASGAQRFTELRRDGAVRARAAPRSAPRGCPPRDTCTAAATTRRGRGRGVPSIAALKPASLQQRLRALRELGRAGRRVAQAVERLGKIVEIVDRLRLRRAGEHRQVGLPVRRRDQDRARPRQTLAERLPRLARRPGLRGRASASRGRRRRSAAPLMPPSSAGPRPASLPAPWAARRRACGTRRGSASARGRCCVGLVQPSSTKR